MILPDANVLIYAFHPEAIQHAAARTWLDSAVNGPARYAMSPQVLASFIRITTNRRAFAKPYRLEESLRFSQLLLDQPNCQAVEPGPRHWEIYTDLCRRANCTGNLTQDAWFAALAIESGCEWITLDRDYRRFPGLRWRTPF
jgi:toxin-antitoxin system PIN domain toxin